MLSETYGDDDHLNGLSTSGLKGFAMEENPLKMILGRVAQRQQLVSRKPSPRLFKNLLLSVRTLAAALEVSRETIRETLHNELGL